MSYVAWADGGNNPSFKSGAACGAVIKDNDKYKVIGRHIGDCTNNVAELYAVKMVLEDYIRTYGRSAVKPLTIYSDSQYCVGMFTKVSDTRHNVALFKKRYDESLRFGGYPRVWNLNPMENSALVGEIRALVISTNASLVWVKGHDMCQENIYADQVVHICKAIQKDYSRSVDKLSDLSDMFKICTAVKGGLTESNFK